MQGFATIHSMSISMYLALCLLEMVASKTASASPASRLLVQHPLLPGNLVKASDKESPTGRGWATGCWLWDMYEFVVISFFFSSLAAIMIIKGSWEAIFRVTDYFCLTLWSRTIQHTTIHVTTIHHTTTIHPLKVHHITIHINTSYTTTSHNNTYIRAWKLLRAKAFCGKRFLRIRASLSLKTSWRTGELRWVKKSFDEMRKVEQWSDEMKIVEKNLDDIWEEMRWDDERWDEKRWDSMNWDELRRAQMRWDEMKCGVRSVKCKECSVKCEVWSVAFQVWHSLTFGYIWNSAPLSHKARTHGPGWRTAHASSIDEKDLIVQP